ncbi:hypothetical protein E3N88_40025 [Mikania micrantha]|uniref:Uncharacterized protein n=1 Tax=Mikania micrantha TaxID=192012 RepID=A0A5N6LNP0_9ASTR|nr:hypothetical protein E3N88_40025 [Mikania micrantha]
MKFLTKLVLALASTLFSLLFVCLLPLVRHTSYFITFDHHLSNQLNLVPVLKEPDPDDCISYDYTLAEETEAEQKVLGFPWALITVQQEKEEDAETVAIGARYESPYLSSSPSSSNSATHHNHGARYESAIIIRRITAGSS